MLCFIRIFLVLFACIFASNAFAAGYTCPAFKKYTSCVADRYLTGTSAGNSCNTCGANSHAPAGNATTTCYCNANYKNGSGVVGSGGSGGAANSSTVSGGAACTAATVTCSAGTYLLANASSCSSCDSGYYCPGGTYTISASIQGRTACPSGYSSGGTGLSAQNQCKLQTTAGKYIATANSSTQTTCEAGYACPAALISYGSTGSRTQCSAGTYNTTTGQSSCSACGAGYYCTGGTNRTACGAGTSSSATNATSSSTCVSCSAGTYSGSAASSCSNCTGRTEYSAAGAASCSTVSSGYYTTGCDGSNNKCTGQSQCTGSTYCVSGVQNSCPAATSGWTLGTGNGWTSYTSCNQTRDATNISSYCSAGQLKQNATSASAWGASAISIAFAAKAGAYVNGQTCTQCSGATYQGTTGSTATSCTSCPTNYTANTTAGKTVVSQCQISCAAGTRVVSPETTCTSPTGGWFTAAHNVDYGQISPVNYCPGGFTTTSTVAGGHDAMSDCSLSVGGGKYIPAATDQVRYIKISSNGSTANTGNHVIEIQAFASSDATGTNLLLGKNAIVSSSVPAAATDGSWSRTPYTSCTSSGCIWDIGSITTVGSIKFALYTDGRTYFDVKIQTSTDNVNWVSVFGPRDLLTQAADSAIGEVLVIASQGTACAAGNYKATHSVALGSTSSCAACAAGTYAAAGAASCSACATGTYSGSGAASCTNCSNKPSAATYSGNATSNACPWNLTCSAGNYFLYNTTETSRACATCTAGNYCAGVTATRSTSADSGLTACPSGYESGGTGLSAQNQCQISVAGGKYLSIVNTTTTGTCDAGTFKAAHIVNYGSTSSCSDCTAGNYCLSGSSAQTACTSLGSNYTSSAAKSTKQQDCFIPNSILTADKYIATVSTNTISTCANGYYRAAGTYYYGSAVQSCTACTNKTGGANEVSYTGTGGGANSCPHTVTNCLANYWRSSTTACTACSTLADGFYPNSPAGSTVNTACKTDNISGKYVASANASSATNCAAGTYKGTHTVNYGSTSSCSACATGTYSGSGAASCTNCSNKPSTATYTGNATSNTCPWDLECSAGNYFKYNATEANRACAACVADNYCTGITANRSTSTDIGLTACSSLASGFYPNSPTSSPAASSCKTNDISGKYVASANASSATNCAAGTYKGTHTVNYGSTSSCSDCTGRTEYSAAGAASCSTVSSGYYTTGCVSNNKCTGQSQCTESTYCVSGVQNSCPAATSGWTLGTGNGWTSYTSCNQTRNATNISSYCSAGQLKQNATSASAWGASAISIAFAAKAGAYVNGQTCAQCAAGTYQGTTGSTATSCTNCVIGAYSVAGASGCTACQNGTTTSTAGKSSCDANCSNNNDYDSSWVAATWAANSVTNLCTINGCVAGYYMPSDICTEVGSGYWSAAGSTGRTACAVGLTTIGFGAGADEAGDCGRILNLGNDKLYLRSVKKTTPSLNVNAGGTTYYGNMSTADKGILRINSDGTKYSVYDDSM